MSPAVFKNNKYVKYDYTVNLAGTGDRSEYDIGSY